MRRFFFETLAILSLIACVAATALWVRSHWRYDSWTRNFPNATESVTSMEGRLFYFRATAAGVTSTGTITLQGPPAGFHSVPASDDVLDSIVVNHPSGFFSIHRADRLGTQAAIMVPHWFVALAAGLLAAGWLFFGRPWRRRGYCRECGYDLRATPDRCPECGAVPGKRATAT